MDPLDAIEKLASQARREGAPSVQVAGAVLTRIRAAHRPRLLALSIFSAATAVAASLILAAGIYYWLAGGDPMDELLPTLQVLGT